MRFSAFSLRTIFLQPCTMRLCLCVSGWLAGCEAALASQRAPLPEPAGPSCLPPKQSVQTTWSHPYSERCHSASHSLTHMDTHTSRHTHRMTHIVYTQAFTEKIFKATPSAVHTQQMNLFS